MVVTEKLYLRENVQIEPLFNRWPAWVLLIPPATAALNLLDRYLKIMHSYVNSPALHVAATQNPTMRGGPFIKLGAEHVNEIRALITTIESKNNRLLAFARAIKQLHQLLADKAKGETLQPLYQQVPDLLRGYVELCYDLNHNPSFRLLESLLYHSDYYHELEASQSFELSEATMDGTRPFMLSTPRLHSHKSVNLPLPFSAQAMDTLFQMRRTPTAYHKLRDRLATEIENEPLFRSFFTTTPPRPHTRYEGKGFRLRYFGHACLLIESAKISILIDPIISYGATGEIPRFSYDDLPEQIDYLLITHSHHDHIVPETLLQLRTYVKAIVVGRNYDGLLQDPSLQLILTRLGFPQVIEIRDMQEIPIPNGIIMGIPFLGEHHDLLMQSKSGYFIRIDDSSVLCIADSCNFEPQLYQHISQIIGMVDLLFLGMECDGASPSWLYGPLFPQALPREINLSRRARGSNFAEACSLLKIFKFKQVYIYAMGQEPWLSHVLDNQLSEESNSVIQLRQLLAECRSTDIVAEYLFGKKEIYL